MPLSSFELDQIYRTILAAYNRDELRRALRLCMDIAFEDYAPDKGFADQLWALLEWARRQDRLKDILRCSSENNISNQALAALWRDAQGWDWTPAFDSSAVDTNAHTTSTATVAGSGTSTLPADGAKYDFSIEYERLHFEPSTILIAAGPFGMCSSPEAAPDEVTLPTYRISKVPISNREFAAYIDKAGHLATAEMAWNGQQPSDEKLDRPVTGVTWYEALAYCQWLSEQTKRPYRLPTEAEWEKAVAGEFEVLAVDGLCEWTCTLWGEKLRVPDSRLAGPWPADDREDGRNDLRAGRLVLRVFRSGGHVRGGYPPDRAGPPGRRHGFRVVMGASRGA